MQLGKALHFAVPMRPFPKQRPRSAAGKRPYMNREYVLQKTQFATLSRAAYGKPFPFLLGKLDVSMVFRYRDNRTADIDNLAGGVMDSLNGVLWKDDRQVRRGKLAIETGCARDEIEVWIVEQEATKC